MGPHNRIDPRSICVLHQTLKMRIKIKFIQTIASLGAAIFITEHIEHLKIHGFGKYSSDLKIVLITNSFEDKLPKYHKNIHAKNVQI